jgi:hypothetical protein
VSAASIVPNIPPDQELSPELTAYFADRRLLRRNVFFIIIGNLGLNLGLGISTTLSIMHMKACGVSDMAIATMSGINLWVVAYLVMYFSWRSDHTVSRWGRRTPFTFISMWFIVITTALFPFYTIPVSLILLYAVKFLFNDMQASTWSLIVFDCVPRHLLGRIMAINTVAAGVTGYLVNRYGMAFAESNEKLVFLLSAGTVLVLLSTAMIGIKEPPIRNPSVTPFRPWSALQLGLKDKRIIMLMLGVTMLYGFLQMWGAWNTLWATNTQGYGLGLSKTELGKALSWGSLLSMVIAIPNGYLIDKISGLRIMMLFWLLQLATLAVVLTSVHSSTGLMVVGLMVLSYGGLFTAGDLMVIKSAHPKDIGSVTSSNAFIRNIYNGSLSFCGGIMIAWSGKDQPHYFNALMLGMVMATVGLGILFLHTWIMRRQTGHSL